jgi:hypothetical protein
MGYFLDYQLFTPCWYCGRTDCSGDHPEAREQASRLSHHAKGFGHSDCTCHVCREMRERAARRRGLHA